MQISYDELLDLLYIYKKNEINFCYDFKKNIRNKHIDRIKNEIKEKQDYIMRIISEYDLTKERKEEITKISEEIKKLKESLLQINKQLMQDNTRTLELLTNIKRSETINEVKRDLRTLPDLVLETMIGKENIETNDFPEDPEIYYILHLSDQDITLYREW